MTTRKKNDTNAVLRVVGVPLHPARTAAGRKRAVEAFASTIQSTYNTLSDEGRVVSVSIIDGTGALICGKREMMGPMLMPLPSVRPAPTVELVLNEHTHRLLQMFMPALREVPAKQAKELFDQLTQGMPPMIMQEVAEDCDKILATRKKEGQTVTDPNTPFPHIEKMRDMLLEKFRLAVS